MDEEESTIDLEQEEQGRKGAIHAVLSFVVALGFVLLGFVLMVVFILTKEEAAQEEPEDVLPTVRVEEVRRTTHEVMIETQGIVRSRREVTLAAEVGGRVISISGDLIEGGRVSEGEVLVEIDPADYRAALARARATLADARLMLEQEQAKAKQAARDWEKLGRGEPTPLVLREPQIQSAEAGIESAAAEVERAERDLGRTTIKAPFDARVRSAEVEVGAVVSPGTAVAALFSGSDLEVRLPFPLRDFGYLHEEEAPEFELRARIGADERRWPAVLDRLEGEVERSTLSGYGIARVLPDDDGALPPVGLFVEARVPGETLEGVVEIPRAVIRGQEEVWVENDGRLQRRKVEVLRSRRENLVVRGDFEAGDRLVRTRLEAPLEGMKVRVEEEETGGGE